MPGTGPKSSGGRPAAAALVAAAIAAALGIAVIAGSGPAGAAVAVPGATGTPSVTVPPSPTATPSPTVTPGTVLQARFEDGTTDGVTGDPATVRVTPATGGSTGNGSVAVTGLTGYSQGARIALPAGLPAGYYGAYASVRLPAADGPLAPLQDMRVLVTGAGVEPLQTGVGRASDTAWRTLPTYFRISSPASGATVQLRVEPVASCSDAPAVPLPFSLDDISVNYIGTIPPPLPLLPTPTCPLGPSMSTSPTITPSVTPTVTPPPPTCRVGYTVTTAWAGGFQGAVVVENLTSTRRDRWTLRWTFPAGQRLGTLWGAVGSQSGSVVTVTGPAWHPALDPHTPVQFGFVATRTDGRTPVPVPVDLTLDGERCRTS